MGGNTAQAGAEDRSDGETETDGVGEEDLSVCCREGEEENADEPESGPGCQLNAEAVARRELIS